MQKSRIWELDAIRGFCILCVIVIHFIFDLQYFAGLDLQLPALYLFIQNNGGVLFILVSGICATLGSRSFRRGIIVFCSGLLISCVIYGMIALNMAGSDAKILFGILHFLGFAMMIYPLLKKLPTVFLALTGAIMIVAGYILLQRVFDTPGYLHWLFVFGIRYPGFAAGDYFPLLPYLGWFMEGIVLGRTLYKEKKSLLPSVNANFAPLRFFRFCGRHSLLIYLVHQPVCYGLLMLAAAVLWRTF